MEKLFSLFELPRKLRKPPIMSGERRCRHRWTPSGDKSYPENGFQCSLSGDLRPAAVGGFDRPRRAQTGFAFPTDTLPRLDSRSRLTEFFSRGSVEDGCGGARTRKSPRARSAGRLRQGRRGMGLSLEASTPFSHRDPVSRALLHSVLPAGFAPARDAGGKSDAGEADAEGVKRLARKTASSLCGSSRARRGRRAVRRALPARAESRTRSLRPPPLNQNPRTPQG